ncbi:transcription antitermination factor NusB [bacterium]|nr:transcription antitermination factor NusB [bacterium]
MKGNRRKAREDALQVLFQLDLNKTVSPTTGLAHFEHLFNPEGGAVDGFTRELVVGVVENREAIDSALAQAADNWRKERMPAVDRNILRLGVFELCFRDDIPATVSINEMVELAKHFGSENTPAFVNGVLDRVKGTLQRPSKAK